MPRKNRNTRESYGSEHRRLRAALLPDAYFTACVRCGKDMLPGQDLDLDHNDSGHGYNGFAHARCNRSAGAIKGNAATHEKKHGPRNSREW